MMEVEYGHTLDDKQEDHIFLDKEVNREQPRRKGRLVEQVLLKPKENEQDAGCPET